MHGDGLPGELERLGLGVRVDDDGEAGDRGGVRAGLLVELQDHSVGQASASGPALYRPICKGPSQNPDPYAVQAFVEFFHTNVTMMNKIFRHVGPRENRSVPPVDGDVEVAASGASSWFNP